MKKNNVTIITKIFFAGVVISIFAIMLYCNIKTPLLADDFNYCFSFKDRMRIESFSQLIPSAIAHRKSINGRVVSHFLLQLFLMLPTWMFKVTNTVMFIALLTVMYKIAFINKERPLWIKPLTFISLFAAVWVFQPAFGNVFLWEAGSINYLWATVLAMIYIYIFSVVPCG